LGNDCFLALEGKLECPLCGHLYISAVARAKKMRQVNQFKQNKTSQTCCDCYLCMHT
jgi:hypothetical protein